jgi:hypothetical protein
MRRLVNHGNNTMTPYKPNKWVMLFAMVGLVTTAVIWFYDYYIFVERDVEIGFRGEARRNPLLAAQRFLEKNHIAVTALKTLPLKHQLPGYHGTLMVPTPRFGMSATQLDEWWQWVDQGGHLVLVSHENDAFDHSFEDEFGLSYHYEDTEDDADTSAQPHDDLEEDNPSEKPPTKKVYKAQLDAIDAPINIAKFYGAGLAFNENQAVPTAKICQKESCFMLHYTWGNGGVTFLSYDDWMNNRQISDHDHAAFLLSLARWQGRQGPVALVYEWHMPSLWQVLWQKGWAACIAVVLLVVAYLWHLGPRFGPIIPNVQLDRRNMLEHIAASGRFLWKHREHDKLVDVVRRAALKHIEQAHPRWMQLEPIEMRRQLAQHAALSIEQISLALDTPVPRNKADFTLVIQLLDAIRKSL